MTITAATTATFDLYRDIHKAIRSELFAVTEEAGRLDPSDAGDRAALAGHVRSIQQLLSDHAEHEDDGIQPVLEVHLPAFAERIAADHERIEARVARLTEVAEAVAVTGGRADVHAVYMELASFTGTYLEHQDLEERAVMPAIEGAIGVEAVMAIHGGIIASIPPDELAQSLALMFPAMNVDDRTELLGGMRATAPAEVFNGVWSLAGSVLSPRDMEALATRLG